MKKNIFRLGLLLLALLIILIFYLSYIHLQKGPELLTHPQNIRHLENMAGIHRGSIFDRKGNVLAETNWVGDTAVRVYPRGRETAHLVGYTSVRYGSTGLESTYRMQLLGLDDQSRFINIIRQATGEREQGQDLVLTLDMALQQSAVNLLGNRSGAVVILDPRTGAVLVAATAPSFDPNQLEEQWAKVQNDPKSPLINRAFQGAYPPGSVMKLITAAGALKHDNKDQVYNCPGYLLVDGFNLPDQVHGKVNLTEALVVSCNTAFGQMGLDMGWKTFKETSRGFGFQQTFGLGVDMRPSTMTRDDDKSKAELASVAIGQGKLLVSPLHMALVAGAYAHGGTMMQPYLVQEIRNQQGKTVNYHKPSVLHQSIDMESANLIREAMIAAVDRGTGRPAGISGIKVAGKTGTAENPHGAPHAWFVGFAPAYEPRVVVAVIVENGGSGGAVAAPMARQLIIEALR